MHNHITHEQFCEALAELLDARTGSEVLAIPGCFEVLSEELRAETYERALRYTPAPHALLIDAEIAAEARAATG